MGFGEVEVAIGVSRYIVHVEDDRGMGKVERLGLERG